jgi:hypothetical protein
MTVDGSLSFNLAKSARPLGFFEGCCSGPEFGYPSRLPFGQFHPIVTSNFFYYRDGLSSVQYLHDFGGRGLLFGDVDGIRFGIENFGKVLV